MKKQYLCLNLHSNKVRTLGNLGENDQFQITLACRREPSFTEGIECVFFDYSYQYGYFFSATGLLIGMSGNSKDEFGVLSNNPEKKEFLSYTLIFRITKKFKEVKLLSDFAYSLSKVKNFLQPFNHFKRQYIYFEHFDFETIDKGMIFIQRTAFGVLFNSLPNQHKLSYIQRLLDKNGLMFFSRRDYKEALDFLSIYIRDEIEERGKFLIEIEKMIRENFINEISLTEVGFADEGSSKQFFIHDQAQKFVQYFEFQQEEPLWEEIEKSIVENIESENRFNQKFSTLPWPINFKDNE